MNSSKTSLYNITYDDVKNCNYSLAIKNAKIQQCYHYSSLFREKAEAFQKEGDEGGCLVFQFLKEICSLQPNYENNQHPYVPFARFEDKRSFAIEDLLESDLDLLRQILHEINDPELKARVADILWITKKDYKAAQEAVYAFIDSAKRLENIEEWIHSSSRIQRAMQIASALGRKKENALLLKKVIPFLEELFEKYLLTDKGAFCCVLMEILLENKLEDFVRSDEYIKAAETLALRTRGSHFEEHYWNVKAEWHSRRKEREEYKKARRLASETYIDKARLAASNKSFMAAAEFMMQGINGLEKNGECKERLKVLKIEFAKYQESSSLSEMQSHVIGIEGAGDLIEHFVKLVTSKPFREAVFSLAKFPLINSIIELEKNVRENAKANPLSQLANSYIVDKNGKYIAREPSILSDKPDEQKEAIEAQMFRDVRRSRNAVGACCINPCRERIWQEHQPSINDLDFLIKNNPFVPSNRELIFAKGLHAGFVGDWIVCAHLLIPQVENTIRCILEAHGVITTKLNADSKYPQEESLLSRLLDKEELKNIFGETLIFELKGLLNEKFGSNLRNRMTHGLMDSDDFNSGDVQFLWWLVIWFCAQPLLKAQKEAFH